MLLGKRTARLEVDKWIPHQPTPGVRFLSSLYLLSNFGCSRASIIGIRPVEVLKPRAILGLLAGEERCGVLTRLMHELICTLRRVGTTLFARAEVRWVYHRRDVIRVVNKRRNDLPYDAKQRHTVLIRPQTIPEHVN